VSWRCTSRGDDRAAGSEATPTRGAGWQVIRSPGRCRTTVSTTCAARCRCGGRTAVRNRASRRAPRAAEWAIGVRLRGGRRLFYCNSDGRHGQTEWVVNPRHSGSRRKQKRRGPRPHSRRTTKHGSTWSFGYPNRSATRDNHATHTAPGGCVRGGELSCRRLGWVTGPMIGLSAMHFILAWSLIYCPPRVDRALRGVVVARR
jgi:hypothetical protein